MQPIHWQVPELSGILEGTLTQFDERLSNRGYWLWPLEMLVGAAGDAFKPCVSDTDPMTPIASLNGAWEAAKRKHRGNVKHAGMIPASVAHAFGYAIAADPNTEGCSPARSARRSQ